MKNDRRAKMEQIQITKPDDWHLHLRDNDMLKETVPATSRCFHRAIVMPNLVPPVTIWLWRTPINRGSSVKFHKAITSRH